MEETDVGEFSAQATERDCHSLLLKDDSVRLNWNQAIAGMRRVPCAMTGTNQKVFLLTGLLLTSLWPIVAHASDMTMLMFFFSLPACIFLVVSSFVMASLLRPAMSWMLAIPVGLLALVHIYMLPHMYHGDELVAFAFQAAISSTSWLAIRKMRRRAVNEVAAGRSGAKGHPG